MRFGKKGKLSPHYIGPYHILRRVRNIAYELELPTSLGSIHLIFHVLMLKNYVEYPSLVVPVDDVGILDSLSYKEIWVEILDWQVCRFRIKDMALAEVLWRN